MLSEKTVWRCGRGAFLLYISSIFFSLFSSPGSETRAAADFSSVDRRLSEQDFHPSYSDKEIAIQERILRTQGEEVNKLHRNLAKPDRANRAVLFYGESGVGKTEGARGLCRRMQFGIVPIYRHQFTSGSYGEGGKKLIELLNTVVTTMKYRGIFIDECDKIFDHPEQQNRDTAQTTNDFWVWLDGFNRLNRVDMVCILACNDIKHFPQPFLNRLSGMMFKFHGPTTPEDKADALTAYFPLYPNIPLHIKQKGKQLFTRYPLFTGRDLQLIYQKACDYAEDNGVTGDHIELAMEKIHQERIDSNYYQTTENPQEQAERHFKWNRALQGAALATPYVFQGVKFLCSLYGGGAAQVISISEVGERAMDTISTTLSGL